MPLNSSESPSAGFSSDFFSPPSLYAELAASGIPGYSGKWIKAVKEAPLSSLVESLAPFFLNPAGFDVDDDLSSVLPPELCRSRILPLIGLCLESMVGPLRDKERYLLNNALIESQKTLLSKKLFNCSNRLPADISAELFEVLLSININSPAFEWDLPCTLYYLLLNSLFVEVVEIRGKKMVVAETLIDGIPVLSARSLISEDLFSLDEMMAAGFLRRGTVPSEIEKVFELPQLKGFVPMSFPSPGARNISWYFGNMRNIDLVDLCEYKGTGGWSTPTTLQALKRFGDYPVFYRGSTEIPLFRLLSTAK